MKVIANFIKKPLAYYSGILGMPILVFMTYDRTMETFGRFLVLLLVYTFLLLPIWDFFKLYGKGLIEKEDFKRCFNPLFRFKFYKSLIIEP